MIKIDIECGVDTSRCNKITKLESIVRSNGINRDWYLCLLFHPCSILKALCHQF
jgi:hypothetical protein